MENPSIRDTADERDVVKRIVIELSDEDKAKIREEMADTMLELASHEEAMKAYRESHVKPRKEAVAHALSILRAGQMEKLMTLQGVIDHQRGWMDYVDEDGIVRDSRKLSREERSTLDFTQSRTDFERAN